MMRDPSSFAMAQTHDLLAPKHLNAQASGGNGGIFVLLYHPVGLLV
jgi:hypothetical protein